MGSYVVGTSEWRGEWVAVKGSTFRGNEENQKRKSLDFINYAYYTLIKNINMFY